MQNIEPALRAMGFEGDVSSDDKTRDTYSTDESIFSIRPELIVTPYNAHDVELLTQYVMEQRAQGSDLSLTARAAGTGLSGGSLTDSIVVDMNKLTTIGEVHIGEDGVATFDCEPGLMWRDMERTLDTHGVYVPSYTSSKDICTIGGSVANNAAGPDSLRYGHCADWVEALDIVLTDGKTYTVAPLTYEEFTELITHDNEYARIAREIFELIEANEAEIREGRPHTKKNTAGYALWDVLPEGVAAFKSGTGYFDLTRVISGSQGTLGIVTSITMRAIPKAIDTKLVAIPIFNLEHAAEAIVQVLTYNPINVEIFDDLTFDLGRRNPWFFKSRLSGLAYIHMLISLYVTYYIRFRCKTPAFTVLVTLEKDADVDKLVEEISNDRVAAHVVTDKHEAEMLWQLRRASFPLSKFQDRQKRPAAFLEDMTVPPENLSKFFMRIKELFKEFNVQSAVHGHGGNGHFHFYPLLDFTDPKTPELVEEMANAFYDTAVEYGGNFCGEHNDGIIRAPYLNKMFTPSMLDIFVRTEHICDPQDIFNPGKKVNPRFDIQHHIRTTN